MLRCVRKSMKYVVLGLVLLGVLAAVFGPYRVQEVLHYVKDAAAENIDGIVPDAVKLRNDMERLREEYPRRIAELKGMVDEIERQLGEVESDRSLCHEVLALCEEDMGELRPKLEALGPASARRGGTVEFRGATFTYSDALERSRRILDIKEMYEGRLRGGTASVELLRAEHDRLSAELLQLQKEYDQFLAEYRSLEREIDLLKHNDKLIEIAGRRERLGRVDAAGWMRSLDAIKRAIDRRRTEQEERLRSFRIGNPLEEYETRARIREL